MPQPKVTIANIMNLKQHVDEPVADFIERYRKIISKCSVQFPEAEYATMAIGNMHPQLKEKLIGQECVDLSQLASKATRIEQFILEKEKRRLSKRRGPNLVAIVEAQDSDEEEIDPIADIMGAELSEASLTFAQP